MTSVGAPVVMACLVSGCLEPTFVSLGHNDKAVLGEADASGRANTPPDDAGSFPFTAAPLACPEAADSVVLTSACETRRPITCLDLDVPAQEALDGVLVALLRECGESVNQVRVSFVAGCADRFDLAENAAEIAQRARDCIALRLDAERYDCALELTCGAGAIFGIPTSGAPRIPAPSPRTERR